MKSLMPNTAQDEPRKLSTEESRERNRRLGKIEATRIVAGMNRLREQKKAERLGQAQK
jgi:hypothetical protein